MPGSRRFYRRGCHCKGGEYLTAESLAHNYFKPAAQNLHGIELTDFVAQIHFTMGKRSRKDLENVEQKFNGNREVKTLISIDDKAVDPSLALLFSSSVSIPLHIIVNALETCADIILGWTCHSTTEVAI